MTASRLCFAPMLLLLVTLTSTLTITGCISPIMATVDISNAKDALKAAAEAGAESKAPYEFYMAQELLRKAEEEWGYAEYSRSGVFADKAMKHAEEARNKAANDPWTPPPPEALKPRPEGTTPAPTPGTTPPGATPSGTTPPSTTPGGR